MFLLWQDLKLYKTTILSFDANGYVLKSTKLYWERTKLRSNCKEQSCYKVCNSSATPYHEKISTIFSRGWKV